MRYLLVDNSNLFIRSYVINPSLTRDGQPIGAVAGSLRSLQKTVREAKPDRIVIVYDAPGGSVKRKKMQKDYKGGRKSIHLNRFVGNLTEEEEQKNKFWQQSRLMDYFDKMPVYQVLAEGSEADDVIAYLCQADFMADHQKVILSSDKDFIQLLDGKTLLQRPKELMNLKSIVEGYSIHPTNFGLAKALVGDKSDNIDGIRGCGMKTVAKRFPLLKEDKTVKIPELVEYCREQIDDGSKIAIYKHVLAEKEKIKHNYKLMQLYMPTISVQERQQIREYMLNEKLKFNKLEVHKLMIHDGLSETSWDTLFRVFRKIIS